MCLVIFLPIASLIDFYNRNNLLVDETPPLEDIDLMLQQVT